MVFHEGRGRRIIKAVLILVSIIALIPVAIVVWLYLYLKPITTIDASVVRDEFTNSPIANTPYFTVSEDTSRKAKDKIFLNIDGVDADVSYVCELAGFAKVCHVEVRKIASDKTWMGLSEYFWNLHQLEIAELLAKYPNLRISQNGEVEVQVLNNDRVAAKAFTKELLEIPDMYNLYQAYKDWCRGSTCHYGTFADFWIEIYSEDGKMLRGGLLLFDWARENNL